MFGLSVPPSISLVCCATHLSCRFVPGFSFHCHYMLQSDPIHFGWKSWLDLQFHYWKCKSEILNVLLVVYCILCWDRNANVLSGWWGSRVLVYLVTMVPAKHKLASLVWMQGYKCTCVLWCKCTSLGFRQLYLPEGLAGRQGTRVAGYWCKCSSCQGWFGCQQIHPAKGSRACQLWMPGWTAYAWKDPICKVCVRAGKTFSCIQKACQ